MHYLTSGLNIRDQQNEKKEGRKKRRHSCEAGHVCDDLGQTHDFHTRTGNPSESTTIPAIRLNSLKE